ncbi:HNH endonuclease [Paraburkholderia denitrificans]|uniref:HNH endonuclease n=1 Tax=Paraburkholderia denitrificans TaxID=694025 RepID=A0ABW0JCF1_9BURK
MTKTTKKLVRERAVFLIDTDAKSNEGFSYHDKWFEKEVAVLSGGSRYLEKLENLVRGDTVLMYVKRKGILGRGIIVDDEALKVTDVTEIVSPREPIEYHRKVFWTGDLRSKPVTLAEFVALNGSNPRHALQELRTGQAEVMALINERSEEIDLAEIDRQTDSAPITEALTTSLARRKQGKYREDLLNLWGRTCAVTGCDLEPILRASHALPWRKASHKQRVDPNNGLPLIPTLDVLFDAGLIGFSDEGTMLRSASLQERHCEEFGLPRSLRQPLNASQKLYLQIHREMYGLK